MHGVPAPEVYNDVHVGPTWAFDQPSGRFLTPIAGAGSVGGDLGAYKKDPMQGGGMGDQEMGFLLRPFSDYSVRQMRSMLERHVVRWDDELDEWATWQSDSQAYVAIENDGVSFPVERDIEVVSVLAATSPTTAEANLVYPPVGPYTAGLIDTFDPTVEAERERAAEVFCPEEGCDVSVRVVQGGEERVYMLSAAWRPDVPTCENGS